jgi:hypothetical protein
MKVGDGFRDTLADPPYATFDKVLGDLADGTMAHPPSGLGSQVSTVSLDLVGVRVQLIRRPAEGIRVDSEAAALAAH